MFWKHLCLPRGNARLPLLWSMGKTTLVVNADGVFPMSNTHPVFVPSTATEVMCLWKSYWYTIERGEFSTCKVLWLQKNSNLGHYYHAKNFWFAIIKCFEMFTMFYSWYPVAVILFKSYSQCLFPITLPLQMDIILSRNYPPTKPVTQDAFRSYPVECIICACTAHAPVLFEHFFTYLHEM